MRRFACRIARGANSSKTYKRGYRHAGGNIYVPQMRKIMYPPLRRKYDDNFTATRQRTCIDNNPMHGRYDGRTFTRKDIDACMNAGHSPRRMPKRVRVPILRG